MMNTLKDKFGREINYLRLSVTDRCNLRCTYCMPERGLLFANKKEILTYEELLQLVDALGEVGVSKIRLTGGEPFVRNELIYFLKELAQKSFLKKIAITSNLTLIKPHLEEMMSLGIRDVNVSLDALSREKFAEITRRDEFDVVYQNLMDMIQMGFNIKVNCVLMKGTNEDEIGPLLDLAREHPISVRFLEEMPFNGSGEALASVMSYQQILEKISQIVSFERLLDEANSTSQNYTAKGFKGNFGIIPSFSRTFCGDCNRLRLAATGEMRTCLYGGDELNVRDMLRGGSTFHEIQEKLREIVLNKPKDGFAAALRNEEKYESMTKLGG